MKKPLALLLCMAFMLLTGCDFITFSVEELLSAPTIADEQSALYDALIAKTGRSVNLEYPRTGENKSAFIFANVDNEPDEEALVFYSYSSDGNVNMSVLDKNDKGNWRVTYTVEGDGSSLHQVYINEVGGLVDIIVGYGTEGYSDYSFVMYRIHDGFLLTLNESDYSVMEICDLDSDGNVEVVLVDRTGFQTKVTVIVNSNGINYNINSADLTAGVAAVVNHALGKLSDTNNAFFVDVLDESGFTYTEILYMTEEGLVCPTSSIFGMRDATRRQYGYNCVDYDSDGRVEIPLTEAFAGYQNMGWSDTVFMTNWLDYDAERRSFSRESSSYYDMENGYVFKLPNRWTGLVTARENKETGEIVFVKYDSSLTLEEMSPLIAIRAIDSRDSVSEYTDSGYMLMHASDYRNYLIKSLAEDNEQLSLTTDEIKNNFHVIKR